MFLVLLDAEGRKYGVNAQGGMARSPGFGTFDIAKLEANVGHKMTVGERSFIVLRPSNRDLHETISRGAQVLTPKDLGALLYEADVAAGSRVLEAGTGSGGLTSVLARTVGDSGKVISYDLRQDALSLAQANLHERGLPENVEFRLGDIRRAIPDRGLDAAFLDIEDPWSAVPSVWDVLRPCGTLATFSPNMEQVKQTVAAIHQRPFVNMRTVELIEREMEVRDVGVRPSFAPLGHTGYLTFARKVLDPFP